MISANEIRNKQIKVVQVGYDKDEVNTLLDDAADTVDSYVAESQELYHKMEILAAKIEEYREEEDSIKAALITAEKMADQIKRESKEKAQGIIDAANEQAKDIIAKANAQLDDASTKAKNIIVDTTAQSEQLIAESNAKAEQIVTNAEKKANEAINSAKIVAQNVLDQAREISSDLVDKSKEEKEAYELLNKTLKEDAREFIEKLKGLYSEQLGFLNSAKLESSSNTDDSEVESIHNEVESLVSEIDEMEQAIPSSINIDDEPKDEPEQESEPQPEPTDAPEDDVPEIENPEAVEAAHDEIIASFNKNVEKEKEKVFSQIENEPEQAAQQDEEKEEEHHDFEIVEDSVSDYTQENFDEQPAGEIPESELNDAPLDNIELDDEPADPREAVEAFSRNQRSRTVETEPEDAEDSLFDEKELPFESYFNVKKEDAHLDRTQTISLIPPEEDEEEDDGPKFKGFFKKKK